MSYDLHSHTNTSDSHIKNIFLEGVRDKSEWEKLYVSTRGGMQKVRTEHELSKGDIWTLIGVNVLGKASVGVSVKQVAGSVSMSYTMVSASLKRLTERGYVDKLGLGKRMEAGSGRDAQLYSITGLGRRVLREVRREMERIGVSVEKQARKQKRLITAIEGGTVTMAQVRRLSIMLKDGAPSEYIAELVSAGIELGPKDFASTLHWVKRQALGDKERAIAENCDRIKFIGLHEGTPLWKVCERVANEVGGARRYFRYYIRRGKFTLY